MSKTSEFKRTGYCSDFNIADVEKNVVLTGWVQKRRNLGSLIFIDLRDRSGLMQVVFDENIIGTKGFELAGTLRSEFCIGIKGVIKKRAAAENTNLKTGQIEVFADDLHIFSASLTPPFPIEADSNTKDEVRLEYRYLDLRRPDLQNALMVRSKIASAIRNFLDNEGFIEIETPILQKSTPEGARDYLVPSRIHPGSFYALPQSPQIFKQLLMVSGFDKYFQIARCFRDEDLRADRQPEFTQVDMELSFVEDEDVISVNESLLAQIMKQVMDIDITLPLPRLPWQEAMDRFGSDKPDNRFGMELIDVSETVKGCGFAVFNDALTNGGSVRGIRVPGGADFSRKRIDKLVEEAKGIGAKGLAYLQIAADSNIKSSFTKFLTPEETLALIEKMEGKPGDLLLFAADSNKIVWDVLGMLRLKLGDELGMIDHSQFSFLWVTDFPLFEWSDSQERYVAMHHPFTMPKHEDLPLFDTGELGKMHAQAYDIVLNGTEIGGGSIRIHDSEIQTKMFNALGLSPETIKERFGFMIDAFKYGVPPHGGLAYGLDRLVMLLLGAESIRDVIAFPKVKDASCLMTKAPTMVETEQLEELSIAIAVEE